jgi:hypothetical protein
VLDFRQINGLCAIKYRAWPKSGQNASTQKQHGAKQKRAAEAALKFFQIPD